MAGIDMFRELDNLRRELDEAFRGIGMGRVFTPAFLSGPVSRRFPQVNIHEDEGNIYVEALVPGVEPGGIEMTLLRNTLTLSGERKPLQPETRNHVWHRNERGFGKFQRSIELPVDVDVESVSAECKNGLLLVTLAKREDAKPKKISVSVS